MKKKLNISIFILTPILMLLVSNCKKIESVFSNDSYLDKYLGVWDFKYIWTHSEISPYGPTGDTTYYTGSIKAGSSKGMITIFYTETESIIRKVEKDGTILNTCEPPEYPPHYVRSCSGYFEGDSIFHYETLDQTPPNQIKITKTSIIGRKVTRDIVEEPPTVSTLNPTAVTLSSAILRGIVNPNFLPTRVWFEYGFDKAYGDSISTKDGEISGSRGMEMSAYISRLRSDTVYHFRVKATNSLGISFGNDMVFSTNPNVDHVTDIDGNVYKTLSIGNQIWMAENLKVSRFNEGTQIGTTFTMFSLASAYCWYNNDSATYGNTYGALYNWYAAKTGKLCPVGWHVPSDLEWTALGDYLGGSSVAGSKMKEAGIEHWITPNRGSTNESGFSGLPAGNRNGDFFGGIGTIGEWWSTDEDPNNRKSRAYERHLVDSNPSLNMYSLPMSCAISVRCIKN